MLASASFNDILARILLPMSLCFMCRLSQFAVHLFLFLMPLKPCHPKALKRKASAHKNVSVGTVPLPALRQTGPHIAFLSQTAGALVRHSRTPNTFGCFHHWSCSDSTDCVLILGVSTVNRFLRFLSENPRKCFGVQFEHYLQPASL